MQTCSPKALASVSVGKAWMASLAERGDCPCPRVVGSLVLVLESCQYEEW